jgi:hypothetical protein
MRVNSHPEQDQGRFQDGGAYLVWSEPPPSASHDLRDDLLRSLLIKRGKMRPPPSP